MKKKLLSLVSILVLSAVVLSACDMMSQTSTPAEPTTAAVAQVQPTKTGDRIVSEGVVVPIQYTYLSFETQGVVEEVMVAEGENVEAGGLIARLKGSAQLEAAVSAAELELLSAEQALDNLKENADVARAQALLRVAEANKALDDAKDKRESKSFKRADESVINNTRAALILAEDSFKRASDVWSYWKDKDEYDVNRAAALTQYSKAQQEYDRAKANMNYVEGYPDQFEVDLAEGNLQVAQANYDKAVRDYEQVKEGPNPKDLALAEARVDNAKSQLAAAESKLDDHLLTAPYTGTLVTSDIKVGQVVGPQTSTVLLADLSKYQVETTDLTELSVVSIKEGSAVEVTFDAITGLKLPGKVLRISPLGQDKQGDITYTVYIDLTKQDPRLRWSMTSSVVFTGK